MPPQNSKFAEGGTIAQGMDAVRCVRACVRACVRVCVRLNIWLGRCLELTRSQGVNWVSQVGCKNSSSEWSELMTDCQKGPARCVCRL
eukprot:3277104-Amphidinium_carterae.2